MYKLKSMTFTLEELKDTIEAISPVQCDFFKENCIVVLEKSSHASGCQLALQGDKTENIQLDWSSVVNTAGYQESKKIVEHGAEALSFFLAKNYTEYTVVEEAEIGTGFDYWLGYTAEHTKYNPKNFMLARLEISGIFKETPQNTLDKRVKEKKEQTNPTDSSMLPAYISVVEFSTPKAYFGKK